VTVLDGFEGAAHGDFGFAEAYIAAEELVHGLGLFHGGFELGGGGELILGFGVGEGGFEFGLLGGVGGGGGAVFGLAGGLVFEEAGGEIAGALFGVGAVVAPFAAAEGVETGAGFAHAFVAGEEVGLGDGEVDFVAFGVFDGEDFHGAVAGAGFDDAEIFADAVFDVDDEVAGLDVGGFVDAFLFGEAAGLAGVGTALGVVGVEVGFCE